MAPSPLCSTDINLNPPSDFPGMIHHVLEGVQSNKMHLMANNSLARGRPIDSNCFEGGLATDPGVGQTSILRPSLTSPTPSHIHKQAQRLRTPELTKQQYSVLPPPPTSAGVPTLQEVLSTTPTRLLPPYPSVGHHFTVTFSS